jgi:hypothetical protein
MKLTYAQKQRLPNSAFAIPELRWGPLVDRSHVANAASRLEAEHHAGRMTGRHYAIGKRRIARAARHYGIHSMYLHESYEANPRSWKDPAVLGAAAAGAVAMILL